MSVPGPVGTSFAAGGYDTSTETEGALTERGVFVSRLDGAGKLLWRRTLATDQTAAVMSIDPMPSGASFVSGRFSGCLSPNERIKGQATGLSEAFLVALGRDGQLLWASWTATTGDHCYATGDLVVGESDGTCVVVGRMKGRTVFGPRESNETVIEAAERERGFVARYTAAGELAWARSLPGTVDVERGAALAVSPSGDLVVAGDIHLGTGLDATRAPRTKEDERPSRGLFIASYGADGTLRWARTAIGDGAIGAEDAAVARDGSRLVTGWFMGEVGFEDGERQRGIRAGHRMDLFVVCYGASGRLRWIRTAGGEGEAYAGGQRIAIQEDGSIEVGGVCGGTVSFSEGSGAREPLMAADVDDYLVARLDSEGRLLRLSSGAGRRR